MLKIGILGVGHFGKIHIKCIQEIPEYQLVGFYDPNIELSNIVSKEYSLKAFDTLDELIDACDIVDVVSTTSSHFECASAALKKFKHVFIEKPVVSTIEEATKLIQIALEADVKVQIGHVERFNPAFIEAKTYIEKPMFIEAHRLSQFKPRGSDVSVVLDLMIHDIDVVLSVVNSNIKRISASGVGIVSETSDIASARIEFDNGCVANLTANRLSVKSMRKARFFQKSSFISVDFLKKEFDVVGLKDANGELSENAILIETLTKGKKEITFKKPVVRESNAIRSELQSFYHAIVNNETPLVTINDGFKSLEVAQEIIDKIGNF